MGIIRWLVEKVKNFIDGISRRRPCSGSVQETVDIDKVLNDFRKNLSPKVAQLEKDSIESVLRKFDVFIQSKKYEYPELVSELKKKRGEVQDNLSNTIINHINKRASTNDEEFKKILGMQPGPQKRKALEKQSEKFLSEAEGLFKEKLKIEMGKLNAELKGRFDNELKRQEDRLRDKEKAYQELSAEAESGQLNIKDIEEDYILVADAYSCMNGLFAQMESEK